MPNPSNISTTAFAPVILAGGSGTRFWPRSRRSRAKQVLALDGERTMIQQTVDRLLPLAAIDDVWVITNSLLDAVIASQLPDMKAQRILSEPAARNTAPAAGLAAFLLERAAPETVIGIFPADHVVKDADRFEQALRRGIRVAAAGENIVVLGVTPSRAETGYGYIEIGSAIDVGGERPRRVVRFTEKPARERAEAFLAAGNYRWNSGIFLWSARTLANALREHCPAMAVLLQRIAEAHGTAAFEQVFADLYPQCENISIDYAVLEPRSAKGEAASGIYCLEADFGWNDIGSWAALHEHKEDREQGSGKTGNRDQGTGIRKDREQGSGNREQERQGTGEQRTREQGNVVEGAGSVVIDATGNYVFAPGKMVALVGVEGLVVVETEDAILVTTLERSQDVGKVVSELKRRGREDLV
ncbi:MAG: mannose-1-phosphate guanylyltransferase [Acidobacteriaceae bacterium]